LSAIRRTDPYWTILTAGGFQVPSMIEGGVSLDQ
jgi:hypothetical protein